MEIVFLGTGGSWPTKERNVSSLATRLDSEVILFDCGEGTQRQLMHTNLSFMAIDKIFISHFHGDHFLGIPGLIQSMALNERKAPLAIYGPRHTVELMHALLGLGYNSREFEIVLEELQHGSKLEFDSYTIEACSVDHHVPTLAYKLAEKSRPGRFNVVRARELGIPRGPLFRELQQGRPVELNGRVIRPDEVVGRPRPGRTMVYANDTRPCENVIELARRCDVLIHDATLDPSLEDKANRFGHSTAAQAAVVAHKSRVKKLFLTHISPRYKDAAPLLEAARDVFPNSTVAEDFMAYKVKLND